MSVAKILARLSAAFSVSAVQPAAPRFGRDGGKPGGAALLVPLVGSPGLCCTVILGRLETQSVSFSVE